MAEYHDREWGVPTHDDREQFEHLMLEAMQCGLSWSLVLRRREILRTCFDNFDFEKVARYTEADVARIMGTEGMIRSEGKIRAVIRNAQCFLDVRREFGSFDAYLCRFTGGKTILYEGHEKGRIPASNGLSKIISRDLKKRGFKYVGAVTVYSHMQACGIINDHDETCPCYARINGLRPTVTLGAEGEENVKQY